ncbi:MAG: oxygen-independent coproporphyrinogen III oxidase [Bacteriovoracia bacterium]
MNLFQKYNVPGPRYTSYPTVPYWNKTPTEKQWVSSISSSLNQSIQANSGAALYIHIPFCESLCTYCGCNTRITRNHAVEQPFVDTILKEFSLYREKLDSKFLVSELHLGGGTPTFLSPKELQRMIEGILKHSNIHEEHEFSVEADPRVTTDSHLEILRELGFRRLSLGIQDFDPKVQEVVHRVQTVDAVKAITDKARQIGFNSINFDLIYGLPFQTLGSIEQTIRAVETLKPDRIAFYGYAHVPWIKPSQRRFTEDDLPTGDQKRALYELGRQMLEESGYLEIGMDHFALETDSLWKSTQQKKLHRNFMGYTSRQVSPLVGLGVSAIGDSWNMFMQNEKSLENWQKKVNEGELPILRGHVLDDEDLVLRRHILNLMTVFETSWNDQETYSSFLESVPDKLREFESDGLLEIRGRHCRVLDKGRAFLRNICMAFDARLSRNVPETRLFSQTI